ncbi:MAG: hypothetical protein HYY43_00110 [Deltaproteobacteria bacterium]|nr:hypothetical protein [Deltaproteobacteria bacterium]MBI2973990.1 hypothetical protein [Deltaproteobacteria bacterium]
MVKKRDFSFSARKKGWHKWLVYCSKQEEFSLIKELKDSTLNKVAAYLARHLNQTLQKRTIDMTIPLFIGHTANFSIIKIKLNKNREQGSGNRGQVLTFHF